MESLRATLGRITRNLGDSCRYAHDVQCLFFPCCGAFFFGGLRFLFATSVWQYLGQLPNRSLTGGGRRALDGHITPSLATRVTESLLIDNLELYALSDSNGTSSGAGKGVTLFPCFCLNHRVPVRGAVFACFASIVQTVCDITVTRARFQWVDREHWPQSKGRIHEFRYQFQAFLLELCCEQR